jgi:phenylpropionate dioxygenase-like ring-hydroxylating dioxygenase large terminal subunit
MTTHSTPSSAHGSDRDAVGFHQSWFPVGLAQELEKGAVTGIDFLGTRAVMYRDPAGKPVVQSAWCPHLGADLSIGTLVDGQIRCAYHHWRFDSAGSCVHIPTGDKIPPGARIFTYPAAEAWGIVWAFNGEAPLFELPAIPGAAEPDLFFEARLRGVRNVANWVALSNGVDFQHLRTLHNLPVAATPETIDVRDDAIEYRVETPAFLQHGRIAGTSTFGLHLRRAEEDSFMLFTGAPIDEMRTRSFYVVGVRRSPQEVDPGAATVARLQALRDFVEKLMAEDEPVLNTMRFRKGTLVAADRHLARYFKYIDEFPRAPATLDGRP